MRPLCQVILRTVEREEEREEYGEEEEDKIEIEEEEEEEEGCQVIQRPGDWGTSLSFPR